MKEKDNTPTIFDFVTGKFVPCPNARDNPSPAWIEGWNAYMHEGYPIKNPYEENTLEYRDWADGWEAALKD